MGKEGMMIPFAEQRDYVYGKKHTIRILNTPLHGPTTLAVPDMM